MRNIFPCWLKLSLCLISGQCLRVVPLGGKVIFLLRKLIDVIPFPQRTATTRVRRVWRFATEESSGRRRQLCRSAWTGSSNTRRRRRWTRATHSGDRQDCLTIVTFATPGRAIQERAETVCGMGQHSVTETWLRWERNTTFSWISQVSPFEDLRRWWYHMRCSGGVMRVVSRPWADVARHTRRPWLVRLLQHSVWSLLSNGFVVSASGKHMLIWAITTQVS